MTKQEHSKNCHYCGSTEARGIYDAATLPANFPQLYACRKCERAGAMCVEDVPEWEQ